MIALGTTGTNLSAFGTAALLESTMVFLNRLTKLSALQPLQFTQVEVIGRPVINVTVWGSNLEHFDESIPFEVNHASCGCNLNFM